MKTMKKVLSKLALMGLALICVVSMGITAFAAGNFSSDSKGTLTVNNVPTGTTVNAYQVIKVNVDNYAATPEYPMYTWEKEVATWLKENNYSQYIDAEDKVTDAFGALKGEESKQFWSALAADIKKLKIVPLPEPKVEANKAVFTDVAMGEYLIVAENNEWTFLPTTAALIPEHTEKGWAVKNGECTLKGNTNGNGGEEDPETSSKPAVNSKTVNQDTFAIGDTLTYTLNVTAPLYADNAKDKLFEVKDTLPAGFAFNKETLTVTVGNKFADGTKLINEGDKYYTIDASITNTFTVKFTPAFYEEYAKIDNEGKITNNKLTIVYDVQVKSDKASYDDAEGVANKADKTNTALVRFKSTQYDDVSKVQESKAATVTTYTFAALINKKDSKDQLISNAAEFTLTRNGKPVKFFLDGSTYYVAGEDKTDALEKITTVNGVLDLKGLGEGEYVLTETKAPEGYVLTKGTVEFAVKNNKKESGHVVDPATKVTGRTEITNSAFGDNAVKFDVVNRKMDELEGSKLPATGGMGTMIFTIGGLCLMVAAVAIGMHNKKNA